MKREPSVAEIKAAARGAAEYAQNVRDYHARRTAVGSPQREADIKIALERLKAAMRPLRQRLGRMYYAKDLSEAQIEQLREASVIIQKERRKLWKLRKAKRRKRRN